MVNGDDSPRIKRILEWQTRYDVLLERLRTAGEREWVGILLDAPAGAATGTEAMAQTNQTLAELHDTNVAGRLGLQETITDLLQRWREVTTAID
ncbi:MAG: hypothetical protein M3176_14675 [Chloroflexota bacterium]|nr:hypothetical protein [Chloroflexota bacterium]